MSFNSHLIPFEEAIAMTRLFREKKEEILLEGYRENEVLSQAETFDKTAVEKLLHQPGCTALRIYYGMKENLQVHAILVGVNENGEDIFPNQQGTLENNGELLEDGQRCPPNCPTDSPLNS